MLFFPRSFLLLKTKDLGPGLAKLFAVCSQLRGQEEQIWAQERGGGDEEPTGSTVAPGVWEFATRHVSHVRKLKHWFVTEMGLKLRFCGSDTSVSLRSEGEGVVSF